MLLLGGLNGLVVQLGREDKKHIQACHAVCARDAETSRFQAPDLHQNFLQERIVLAVFIIVMRFGERNERPATLHWLYFTKFCQLSW